LLSYCRNFFSVEGMIFMSIRDRINNNPFVSTVAIVLLLGVSLTLIWSQVGTGGPQQFPDTVYYYDLNTSKLFAGPRNPGQQGSIEQATNPNQSTGAQQVQNNAGKNRIEAPSGPTDDGKPAGVRAWVFACGTCPSLLGKTYKEALETEAEFAWVESEHGISEPGKVEWVSKYSSRGTEIMDIELECGDAGVVPCFPE
jgi:hypothetical protein